MSLSRHSLSALPPPSRPMLAGGAPEPGIAHLGLGAFHRAHQAVYTERAMALTDDRSWGIVGVAPRSRPVVEALRAQDGLFTVLERDGDQRQARVANAVASVLHAPSDGPAVAAVVASPAITVVTLTITEKGYLRNVVDGTLRDDAEVRADAAAIGAGRTPSTALGLLVAGLQRRASAGARPVSVVSCDNLVGNGRQLSALVRQFVERLPAAMAAETGAFVDEAVSFPSTMVDRIVPATTPEDVEAVRALTTATDHAAVVTEPFSQWVLEDDFVADRPAWERAGAEFVDDVRPYETTKLRVLNAAHSMIAYLGALAGYRLIADALADHVIETAVRGLMAEVMTTIDAPAGWNLHDYAESVLTRFGNRALGHRCEQVGADGSQKLPVRIVPTLRDVRATRGDVSVWALTAIAAWARIVVHGRDDDGRQLQVAEPLAAQLRDSHEPTAHGPVAAVVRRAGVLPDELADAPEVVGVLNRIYRDLERHGVLSTCRALAGQSAESARLPKAR